MGRANVPAPGFTLVTDQRPPPGGKWFVQFRCGYVDERHEYEPKHLRWRHEGHGWDVMAIRAGSEGPSGATWNPKSGGY